LRGAKFFLNEGKHSFFACSRQKNVDQTFKTQQKKDSTHPEEQNRKTRVFSAAFSKITSSGKKGE